jgi:mannose-6-phosphate isomerase-like protein (cupin superfamily)
LTAIFDVSAIEPQNETHMKLTRKNQTQTHVNGPACSVVEYPMDDARINVAIVHLTGRYPDAGAAMNLACAELAYVAAGSGTVTVDEKETAFAEGDAVLIEPNEKFFWDGTMTLIMPCAPAWEPGQYRAVEG